MIREIDFSSYQCVCGFRLNFCERTIREIKHLSKRKRQRLIADDHRHVVVFAQERAVDIECPTGGKNENDRSSLTRAKKR
ncbi:MAG TPA: hypothetical protein VN937_20145 [Blastocatellia bacterium]|nr:hypothetical protein [Blastocatellia bacterium]